VPAAAGEAVKLLPVATEVPLQLPKYHFQLPPVPKLPPFNVSVLL
jgi:hypothetical protein